MLGSVRHQDQRQDTLVHVERIETEVEVAVDGLEHIFGKSEGCVGARVKCVWKEKKKERLYIYKKKKMVIGRLRGKKKSTVKDICIYGYIDQ